MLNTFQKMDGKAMEQVFQDLSEKGWILLHYGKTFLQFQSCTPKKRVFYIETFFESNQLENDYYEFCREQGWTLCFHNADIHIFYSDQDAIVHQLETSDDILYKKIQSTSCIQPNKWSFIICFLTLNVVLYQERLLSNFNMNDMILPFCLTFLSIWFIFLYRSVRNQRWMIRCRNEMETSQVLTFPIKKKWKNMHKMITLITLCNIIAYILAFMMIPHKTIALCALLYQVTPFVITIGIGLVFIHILPKKKWLNITLSILMTASTLPLHTLSILQNYPASLALNKVTTLDNMKHALNPDTITLSYQSSRAIPLHITLFMDFMQLQKDHITIQYDAYRTVDDAIQILPTLIEQNNENNNLVTRVYDNNNNLLYGFGTEEAKNWHVDEIVQYSTQLLLRKENIIYSITFPSNQNSETMHTITTCIVGLQKIFQEE